MNVITDVDMKIWIRKRSTVCLTGGTRGLEVNLMNYPSECIRMLLEEINEVADGLGI